MAWLDFRRLCLLFLVLVVAVRGQQQPQPSTSSASVSNRISTSFRPSPSTSLNANASRALGDLRSIVSVLHTALPSTSASASPSESISAAVRASKSGRPKQLDTKLDPTFGVLGGLLIVSGLAIGTVGTLHRRSGVFIAGTYAGSLVVGLLVVKFALVDKESPPKSVIRGVLLLAALVAGIVGGGFCYLFHKAGTLLQSSLAGFLLSSTLLCVRSDSLIRPIGLRYILLLGLTASFFVLSSIPRLSLPLVLVSTSILGSIAVVVGIDCFTTAGLKEFYVYNFGFNTLFPKLQGHYTLDSSVTIELGVILALFICMMAFQHRFYVLMGRKQQSEQENEQERTVRSSKLDERARKNNEAQMGDWEEKYGNGRTARRVVSESAALDGRNGKRKNWFGFGKSKKMSKSGSTSSSTSSTDKSGSKESANAASVDFLPRLEVEFGELQYQSTRPALSTLQATSAPTPIVKKEGWDDYLSTRQVAMSSFKSESLPARSRSSLALVSPPSSLPKSSPRFKDEGDEDEDDDTPLALSPRRPTSLFSGAVRSHSSPLIDTTPSRRATMYEHPSTVCLPEPVALPRSHSRALSLVQQIPSVLLESPSASRPALPRSDSQPGTLDKAGRRATLLDLNEPSNFNPYNERQRQRTASDDRIVTGDRRKSLNVVPTTPKKVKEGPKIMDFEDLDAKHRKRLSLLQTTAVENVAAETAKAEFLQKQQAEAVAQRRKDHERRRSLSSNNILASSRTSIDEFGQLGGGEGKGRPKSVASLSGLLSLKRNSSSGDLLDESPSLETPRRREPVASPTRTPQADRRQSAQSFASSSKRLSQTSLASPPRNVRRHSLTTLLETSFDDVNSDGPAPPLVRPGMNERSASGGLEKVTEWRRSGTLASLRAPSIQSPPPAQPASVAVVDTPTVTKKASKKNSWLDY
ncbi:hypothetical protein JCM3765_002819 [Sporobolomyces pararoseus]